MKKSSGWAFAAAWGAVAGAVYFVADFTGTLVAVHQLFDPTAGTAVLLLVGGCGPVILGALLGVLAWGVWLRKRPRGRLVTRLAALGVLFVLVAAGGFLARLDHMSSGLGPRPAVSARRPVPVLWVVMDATRADMIYGDRLDFPLAPGIRRFAKDAIVFSDAESTAGWTIPSVAAMLTGIHNTTMDASAGYLPDWAPTAAERLRAAGFETHAIVDNGVLESRNGFAAGFESFFLRSGYRFVFCLPGFRLLPVGLRETLREALPVSYYGAEGVTDAAVDILRRPHDAPLFLYVQYMDAHDPYYPHPELGPDPPDSEPVDFFHLQQRLHDDPSKPPTPGQLHLLKHRYRNELRVLDRGVGRLLAAWRARFGDNAIVILTADHGEGFLEHGTIGHGMQAHRELVHVPLLLALPPALLPAEGAHGRNDHPVSLIDLLPTVLDVLGVDARPHEDEPAIQGHSWLAWLQGSAPAPDRPIFSSHSRNSRRTFRYREGNMVFLRTDYYDDRPQEVALYDLTTDPTEQTDLSAARRAQVTEMGKKFKALAIGLREAFKPGRPSTARANEESLRALGYIQ